MTLAERAIAQILYPLTSLSVRTTLHLWRTVSTKKPNFVFGGHVPTPLILAHLDNARLYVDRVSMLEAVPKRSVGGEVGTYRGEFAARILSICQPTALHLFDFSFDLVPDDVIASSTAKVEKHVGDSSVSLSRMQDGSFDFIYIDGEHRHFGVKKDVEHADRIVKPGGLLMFNDYILFDAVVGYSYGVMHVVNDLCITKGYKVIGFALQSDGYNDILLRKPT